MKTRAYLLHAMSPLHAGTGQGVDVIDLPIARMRSTGIPLVPGSSIKGVLRDARRDGGGDSEDPDLLAVFGPATEKDGDHAGALVAGDARLLALPVRCFKGTFAWVSSPLLLSLAARDLEGVDGVPAPLEVSSKHEARVGSLATCLNVSQRDGQGDAKVYLEDLDLGVREDPLVAAWGELLARVVYRGDEDTLRRRFVVVDDETMTFLWETATQLDTRVRLDADTRTVAKGALWVEESLPPETLLIGLLAADRSRRKGHALQPAEVLDRALSEETTLQFGGKATVGRGRCRMLPLEGRAA